MNNPSSTPDGTVSFRGPWSVVGQLSAGPLQPRDGAKKWTFNPDPFTALGSDGKEKLCTLAKMFATAYRGQAPSGLDVVMDFDYTTYGWDMPYSAYWQLQMLTGQGILLETFSFNVRGAAFACPPRTVHFNYTYQAANDYFGVLEKVAIHYVPGGPISHCS